METIQGLNELIKNRLKDKKGNVKLTENTDIILYGKALGFNENQLLFKVIEIEETIDWAKENENVLNTDTFIAVNKAPSINNVIYCSNCNAANEKGIAKFCVDCGGELNPEPIKTQSQFVTPNTIPEKSKTPYILGALALGVIIILGGLLYSKNTANNSTATSQPTNELIDSTQIQNTTVPNSVMDTTSVAPQNETNTEDALKILSQYYYDINNSNFDANTYFSENVSQFISRHNLTPNDINTIFNQNNEFLRGQSVILNNQVTFERTENNLNYYSYWVDYSCYRKSKNKNEFCKVNVEVGFNENNKITSYKELRLSDLRFEEAQQEEE